MNVAELVQLWTAESQRQRRDYATANYFYILSLLKDIDRLKVEESVAVLFSLSAAPLWLLLLQRS